MSSQALCDGFYFRPITEVESQAAALRQRIAVQLQPSRRAPSWKPTIGHDNVYFLTGLDERSPVEARG